MTSEIRRMETALVRLRRMHAASRNAADKNALAVAIEHVDARLIDKRTNAAEQ